MYKHNQAYSATGRTEQNHIKYKMQQHTLDKKQNIL